MRKKIFVAGIIATNFLCACAQVQQDIIPLENSGQTSIMLMGVYHFDNPGKDAFNTEVDDYSSERRQNEIKEVVDLLKAFKPTKIFVELSPEEQSKLDSLYELFVTDKITLDNIQGGLNEIYQIGFRIGKQLDLNDLIAIDHQGNWLGPYADFIADTLLFEDYLQFNTAYAEEMKDKNELFLKNSVKENLIYLNEKEQIEYNHQYYNNVAIRVKDTLNIMFSYQESEQEIEGLPYQMRSFDFNNIGVELVAEWYKRNLFIYRNILENTQESDRILVIIGSGHIFYLNSLFEKNSNYRLTNPNTFLNSEE